jgi:serine-type D-Ala-D-Ala carboxypeptidase/endopeptidase (penicillin-binding protein 4)
MRTIASFPKRSVSVLLVLTLGVVSVFSQHAAQEIAPPKPKTIEELQSRISRLLEHPRFAAARWGVLIETRDGRILYEREADKAFMPASNMKLYTTAAALDAFGPAHKFKTSVYATSPVSRRGEIRGDLILYGRGDPNLSPRFETEDPDRYNELKPAVQINAIERLADQIKRAGVRIVLGDLIGDDSYFAGDLLGPSWEWDDLQFSYGAEVSALTVNDNIVSFKCTPGPKVGDPPVIAAQPLTGYVKIVNHAQTTAGGATKIGVHRPFNSNIVEFFGTIPLRAGARTIEIAVHDPARYAATLLKEALSRRGVTIRGEVQRMDALTRLKEPFNEKKLEELASVQSVPMSEILKVVNKESQNLHTEILLRQLGVLRPGEKSIDEYGRPTQTASAGNDARKEFLTNAGVDITPLSLRDGSGLARQDLITPRATARLLEFMASHPQFAVFRESLPIAGVDGTLERRMMRSAAASNVRAKTGSLSYVNSLSGYVTTRQGLPLIFSMVANNYTGAGRDATLVMDEICILLAEYDGEAP